MFLAFSSVGWSLFAIDSGFFLRLQAGSRPGAHPEQIKRNQNQ
jgi:hypothetical protein